MRDRLHLQAPYGIYIIVLWSIVLGLQNFIRLVYTLRVGANSLNADFLARFYFYQWFSFGLGIAFLVAAFGLWQRRNWGRQIFLAMVILFFATALYGLFSASDNNFDALVKWELAAQYLFSIALPWIYLNLKFVKEKFQTQRINDEKS